MMMMMMMMMMMGYSWLLSNCKDGLELNTTEITEACAGSAWQGA
jgi:hypothetical protein